jgi:hypothetical protein
MFAFILALMSFLQPTNAPGVKWDYEPTARAIAKYSFSNPLWPREERGIERTADLLVSLSWFESNYNPDAEGDGHASFGLYQMTPGTAGSSPDALKDPDTATRIALSLIRTSFRICKDYPADERLGWYAHGGNSCANSDGRKKSKHRMWKAEWLGSKVPMPESVLYTTSLAD